VGYDGVISNQLTFEIVEPKGEEVRTLRIMEEALKALSNKDRDGAAVLYRQVVERYPESGFAEMCCYLSIFNSHFLELKEQTWDEEILKEMMLERYPNSGQSGSWIHALTFDKPVSEKLMFLDELLRSYPSTRCYQFAELIKGRLLKSSAQEALPTTTGSD
jgi:hypothetical protein